MAAGTIVVRDSPAQTLRAIRDVGEAGAARSAMLSDEEHALIARFVARRSSMAAQPRRALAEQIADRIRTRVSRDLQHLDAEELLERLNAAS
jgi:hypothetical protein